HLSLLTLPIPTISTLFPYTTLFRSVHDRPLEQLTVRDHARELVRADEQVVHAVHLARPRVARRRGHREPHLGVAGPDVGGHRPLDRKSTRLNSSHVKISYAVFCLKK